MTMPTIALFILSLCIAGGVFLKKNHESLEKKSLPQTNIAFYNIKINTLIGDPFPLIQFKGKIILVVNVASKCGFTEQYKGLETLYRQFQSDGLIILGIPSNDFGGQEPGTAKDIQSFCQLNYNVSFPMTEKVTIKGEQQHELYRYLTQSTPPYNGKVKWNFTKFLINQNGEVVDRFSPVTKPLSKKIVNRIKELAQK